MEDDSRLACSPNAGKRGNFYVTLMHLSLLIGLSLALSWPVIVHGIPDLSGDGYHHARWARQFCTQFWAGELFPRWFSNVNGGLGGPSGFFSPPLTNYVSALFWPFVSHADPKGWLAAGYPVVLGVVLSAVAAYFWLLSFGSARGALLGTIFYVAAPYHLAMDVFVRGASSEAWVFVWFPLVLLAAEKLIRHSRWAIAVAAISFALAVLSHPTTSLCFVPIPISYVFFFSEGKDRARNASLMLASLLLGVGLSAVYIVPAMLDQGKAQTQLYRIGMLDYHNEWLIQDTAQLGYFLQRSSGAAISKSSDVGFLPFKSRIFQVTALTLLMAVLLFMVNRRFEAAPRPRRLALFWITVALITLFLMNRPSAFVWNLARFLQFLQFPFRLNIMLVICVAALVPLAYPYLKTAKVFTVVLCALLGVWLLVDVHYSRTNFFATGVANRNLRLDYEPSLVRQIDAPEMFPIPGNPSAMSSISAFDLFVATHPPRAVSLEAIARQSSGTVVVQSWQPRHIVLKIDALRSTVLKVNHFYYSGWRAQRLDISEKFAAYPSASGLLQVDIPKGSYQLALDLPLDGAERMGVLLSILSAILVGDCVGWAWRRQASSESHATLREPRAQLVASVFPPAR